jgi:hypothetical protein
VPNPRSVEITYHAIKAIIYPTLIFQNNSALKSEKRVVGAENAASRARTETSAFFNDLHSHCVYAKPTEVARLTWTRKEKVVPYLRRFGQETAFR